LPPLNAYGTTPPPGFNPLCGHLGDGLFIPLLLFLSQFFFFQFLAPPPPFPRPIFSFPCCVEGSFFYASLPVRFLFSFNRRGRFSFFFWRGINTFFLPGKGKWFPPPFFLVAWFSHPSTKRRSPFRERAFFFFFSHSRGHLPSCRFYYGIGFRLSFFQFPRSDVSLKTFSLVFSWKGIRLFSSRLLYEDFTSFPALFFGLFCDGRPLESTCPSFFPLFLFPPCLSSVRSR